MPQQWWFVLREHTSGQGRLSPNACNGLINRLWPQPDAKAHDQAKPFVLHGLPQSIGPSYLWSVTWLSDLVDPPRDLRDQTGTRWSLGKRDFDVETVIPGARRSWAYLLETPPTPRIEIRTITPVLSAKGFTTGDHKQRVWTPYPTLPALLGTPPRTAATDQTVKNHRQKGIFSVLHAYADPHISALVTEQMTRTATTLTLIPDPDGHTVKPVPGPEGLAWGWTGKCTLATEESAGYQGLALIGAIMRNVGVGPATAYGYGCVSIDQPRKTGHTPVHAPPPPVTEPDITDEDSLDILYEGTE